MSGIVGYINTNKIESTNLIDKMIECILFSENSFIDKWKDDFISISRVHHGVINPQRQPIFNEDKSLFIIMMGEVFDYEEKRRELINNGCLFRYKDNDAEFCLNLFMKKGLEAFKELNGSFLIVIYNQKEKQLLIANDRFASYPIYYYHSSNGTLLFGTQVSSIIQSEEVPQELNISAIFEFFTFQRCLGTKTFFKNVYFLPPATILKYEDFKISFLNYWERKYKEEKHSKKHYVEALVQTLKKSVERRTRDNHRFGILLSGGLDSRAVLAASEKKMKCFTVGYFENREVKIAKSIAKAKECNHYFLKRDADHYYNIFDKALDIGDGMLRFDHAHFIGYFDEIKKECEILFHGYMIEGFFRGTRLPLRSIRVLGKNIFTTVDKIIKKNILFDILEKNRHGLYKKFPQQLFKEHYIPNFKNILINSIKNILDDVITNNYCENIYDGFTWLDTYYQPSEPLFLFENSIRAYMDERNILFDNDVLNLYLKMPFKLRSNSGLWKKALAKLDMEICRIPDANTSVSPSFPEFIECVIILSQKIIKKLNSFWSPTKKPSYEIYNEGSWPNFDELIRQNEKLRSMIKKTILDNKCLDPNIFNINRIKELFEEHLKRENNNYDFLCLLLTYGLWHKKYIKNN